jgi:hypothetical protein
MTEGWGMVAAAAIGVIGALCGLIVGRRMVRDQAQVEHEQWLRGQRQEAYVALLSAWDETVPKFEEHVIEEHEIEILDEENGWADAAVVVRAQAEALAEPVKKAVERVHMLGPRPVDAAATAMLETVADLAVGIAAQFVPSDVAGRFATYEEAKAATDARRDAFVVEARKVVQTAPDPKRR